MALEDDIKKMDFRSIVFTSIVTALAFVVGLFWKDAVTGAIDEIIPKGEGLFYKFLAAIIVTIVIIIIIYVLLHMQKVAEKNMKMFEKIRIEQRNKMRERLKKHG